MKIKRKDIARWMIRSDFDIAAYVADPLSETTKPEMTACGFWLYRWGQASLILFSESDAISISFLSDLAPYTGARGGLVTRLRDWRVNRMIRRDLPEFALFARSGKNYRTNRKKPVRNDKEEQG